MATKVLLIYEDYSELNTVQSTLKKVGFDCVGISSEFSTSEQVLSFNPDIVIANGKGPKVSTTGVGRRLKDMHRWNGKTILIFPTGVKPKPQDLIKIRMDVVLEAPVQVVRLIQVLANLTNQDDQALIERLIKTVSNEDKKKEESYGAREKKENEDRVYISGLSKDEARDDSGRNRQNSKDRNTKFGKLTGHDSEEDGDVIWTHGGNEEGNEKKRGAGFVTRESDRNTPSSSSRFDIDPEDRYTVRDDTPKEESSQDGQHVDWTEVEKELFKPPSSPAPQDDNALFPLAEAEEAADVHSIDESADLAPENITSPEEAPENSPPTENASEDEAPAEETFEALQKEVEELEKNSEISSAEQTAPSEVTEPSSEPPQESEEETRARILNEALVAAHGKLGDKLKQYQKYTENLELAPESTIKRTEVRKAQRDLKKDWNDSDLQSQDELRREFTKALFRKN